MNGNVNGSRSERNWQDAEGEVLDADGSAILSNFLRAHFLRALTAGQADCNDGRRPDTPRR